MRDLIFEWKEKAYYTVKIETFFKESSIECNFKASRNFYRK